MEALKIIQKDNKTRIFIDGKELKDVLSLRLEKASGDDFVIVEFSVFVTGETQVEIL